MKLSLRSVSLWFASLALAGCQASDYVGTACEHMFDYESRCSGLSMCKAELLRTSCNDTLADTYQSGFIKLLADCTPVGLACDVASKQQRDDCLFKQLPTLSLSRAFLDFTELACTRCPTYGDPGGDVQRCREKRNTLCPDDDCVDRVYADSVYEKARTCLTPTTGSAACAAIASCIKQSQPPSPPASCP